MQKQIEVKIQVIIHATDDFEKIKNSLVNVFSLNPDNFKIQNLTGHFENPITMLTTVLKKNTANEFASTFIEKMKKSDLRIISETLEEKITNTGLKIKISKQKIILGKIVLDDKDAIKITIMIPVYVKKNITKIYHQTLKIPE
jgi:RNA binding exosome subunit|tara:strand:- start:1592 stop:2020 length:429 start_codon:yes stop_codon:yes gene_type:complete